MGFMLSKCANPSCTASFLYFHQGKLFRMNVEKSEPDEAALTRGGKRVRRMEFFWLCDGCSSRMTLEYDQRGGVLVKALEVKSFDHGLQAAS